MKSFKRNSYIFIQENAFENVIWEMAALLSQPQCVNTLGPRQNQRYFADDIFKCIFVNENVWIPIKISLKFVSKGPINNIPTLVQIMAWCQPGDKLLSEPMMISLMTHICVTRPQWVKERCNINSMAKLGATKHLMLLSPAEPNDMPSVCNNLQSSSIQNMAD